MVFNTKSGPLLTAVPFTSQVYAVALALVLVKVTLAPASTEVPLAVKLASTGQNTSMVMVES